MSERGARRSIKMPVRRVASTVLGGASATDAHMPVENRDSGTTPQSRGRYMTQKAKDSLLAEWLSVRSQPAPDGAKGGCGFPDPEVFPLCDNLNSLPYICTLQSCAGHVVPAADGTGDYIYNGQVWLWLSAEGARRFYERVHLLAAVVPLIERVQLLWQSDGQEVVDVTWRREMLSQATTVLPRFFGSLIWSTKCEFCGERGAPHYEYCPVVAQGYCQRCGSHEADGETCSCGYTREVGG